MTGRFDVFFKVDRWIAESELRVLLACRKRRNQFLAVALNAHSSSTAAGRCLDYDRLTYFNSDPRGLIFILDHAVESRGYRDANRFHRSARLGFVTHQLDCCCPRSDKLYV